MTPDQHKVLGLIADHIATEGVSPSYDEIAKAAGYKSKGQVHAMVERLVSEGVIDRTPSKARSIRLTGKCPTCGRGA